MEQDILLHLNKFNVKIKTNENMKLKDAFLTRCHFFTLATLFFIAGSLIVNDAIATNYYVSASGNDAANGLAPSSSWLTIKKINNTKFNPGDSILFKRGDAWRGGQALYASSNGSKGKPIVFGAYGTGAKPLILGSKDISSSTFWTNSSGNIWKTTSVINITTVDGRGRRPPQVANLIFNNEASVGTKKKFLSELKAQGDFSLNFADTLLYIYSTVNPSTYYTKIEAGGIRNNENNIEIYNGHYLTFTNLDIRYSKNNGLFIQDCSYIEVNNCDFSYIGGCYFPIMDFMLDPNPNTARMGNGVQIWLGNSDITVKYCNINQVYDAGISPQGGDNSVIGPFYAIHNMRFHHNFINNCFYSFEFWGHNINSTGDSIFFENNTCVNAGGWSVAQRPDRGRAAHLQFSTSKMAFSKVFIRNNIFGDAVNFCSDGFAEGNGSGTDAVWAGITMDYNLYFQSSIIMDKPVIRWRGGNPPKGGIFFMFGLAQYQALSGKEAHSKFADPLTTPNYELLSNSPAIDAGIDVGFPFNGTAPDIGAFEYISGDNHPPSITNQNFQLTKNSPNGTSVGTVIASDSDAGQTLNYSILSGNTNGALTINTSTGVLSVVNSTSISLDITLIVKVQDNGIGALSSQATITITSVTPVIVLNVNNNNINVYPNPVTNELIIEIKGIVNKQRIEIRNSIGQIVYNGKLSEKTVVDTSNFSGGMYFLKIEKDRSFEVKKLLKL